MSEKKEMITYLRVQAPDTSTAIIGIEQLSRYQQHNDKAKKENKKYYLEIIQAEAKYDKAGNLLPVQTEDVVLVKVADGSAKSRYVSKNEVHQLNSKLLEAEDVLSKKDEELKAQAEEIEKLRAVIAAGKVEKKPEPKKDEPNKDGKGGAK